MDKYKLMEALSDHITFGEAISFYDSFSTPKLDELREHRWKADVRKEFMELESKGLKEREKWLRAMIVDYNRDEFPSPLKDSIAKQVGEYMIKSALGYIARLDE